MKKFFILLCFLCWFISASKAEETESVIDAKKFMEINRSLKANLDFGKCFSKKDLDAFSIVIKAKLGKNLGDSSIRSMVYDEWFKRLQTEMLENNIPVNPTMVIICHMVGPVDGVKRLKALGPNWKKALSAKNIEFLTQYRAFYLPEKYAPLDE